MCTELFAWIKVKVILTSIKLCSSIMENFNKICVKIFVWKQMSIEGLNLFCFK